MPENRLKPFVLSTGEQKTKEEEHMWKMMHSAGQKP